MYTQKENDVMADRNVCPTESDRAWLCIALFVIGLVLVIVLDGCGCDGGGCRTHDCYSSDATPQTETIIIDPPSPKASARQEKPEEELEPPGEIVHLPPSRASGSNDSPQHGCGSSSSKEWVKVHEENPIASH